MVELWQTLASSQPSLGRQKLDFAPKDRLSFRSETPKWQHLTYNVQFTLLAALKYEL